jgi:hypothetical protein
VSTDACGLGVAGLSVLGDGDDPLLQAVTRRATATIGSRKRR